MEVISQLLAHSPSLGRPKEGARKVALPDLVGAGAGPALSLRKAYSVHACLSRRQGQEVS